MIDDVTARVTCHDGVAGCCLLSPSLSLALLLSRQSPLSSGIDGIMTSHILTAVFLIIVLSIVLNHSEGLVRRKDVAFIAAGVRSNNRRPTINSALFSAQPPPRRLLKKVNQREHDDYIQVIDYSSSNADTLQSHSAYKQ